MTKLVVITAIAAALTAAWSGPGSAFIFEQLSVIAASQELSNTIEVKWKKRPPGWDSSRKVGWRGGRVPPGQRYR